MSSEEKGKTFEEMLHNPEDLPTDPEALSALISGTDPADSHTDPDPNADADAKAKEEADAKAKADADAKAKADDDAKAAADKAAAEATGKDKEVPDGVLLKDGQKVLPYSVLEATRRREDQERRAREEAEARVKELTAELEKAKKGGEVDAAAAAASAEKTSAMKEKIEALKAEVPEVAELFDGVLKTVDALTEQVNAFKQRDEEQQRRQEDAAAERVQQAIDGNAKLRYWQNEKPDLFNEAARLDRSLRESPNPRVQALTMEQRFEKVVQMMEDLHGPAELPESYRGPAQRQDPPPPASKEGAGKDVKADAKAKLEDKALTLSDLPGGAPPSDAQKAVEEMTTGDIDAAVNRMLDKGMSIQDILGSYR